MNTIIKQLSQTSSKNEKIKIIESHSSNENLLDILWYCYNPFIQMNIKKVKATSIGDYDINEIFHSLICLINDLHDRKISGNNAREAITKTLNLCNKETQTIILNVIKKDLRCGINTKTINSAIKGLIPQFEIQLANTYDPDKDYKVGLWFVTPKLDGLRCIYKNNTLYTRSGKPVIGFDHILEELNVLSKEHNLSFIDGELYTHGIDFQTIQGYVMSNKNINIDDKKKVKYNIFASSNDSISNTKQMIDLINQFDYNTFEYVNQLEYQEVKNNTTDIIQVTQGYVNKGFEGAMLRHQDNYYDWKRSNALLKVKFFLEDDFFILNVFEGTGKYTDMLGGFLIKGNIDGKTILSDVGSGFTDQQRKEFWQNQDKIIGSLINVKYQNLTDKPNPSGNYSLRFPVFIGFKEDR